MAVAASNGRDSIMVCLERTSVVMLDEVPSTSDKVTAGLTISHHPEA